MAKNFDKLYPSLENLKKFNSFNLEGGDEKNKLFWIQTTELSIYPIISIIISIITSYIGLCVLWVLVITW